MPNKITLTYSAVSAFQGCKRAYKYRYIDHLSPKYRDDALGFGTVIHSCLERWHGGEELGTILSFIDREFHDRHERDSRFNQWQMARSMMTSYNSKYLHEEFIPVALEEKFSGPIVDPDSGLEIPTCDFAGKVDGIVKNRGGIYLLEHKTASQVTGGYIESLWADMQISLYTAYMERKLNTPLDGVVYNVLEKAKIHRGKGESDLAFSERKAELIAKSKTGKTTAKQKQSETISEFAERMDEKYSGGNMLHREELVLSRRQITDALRDLFMVAIDVYCSTAVSKFPKSTGNCFKYGKPCPYWQLCKHGENSILIDTEYDVVKPHVELETEAAEVDIF